MSAARAIYVPLPRAVAYALGELARREHRHPRDQATVILIDGLSRSGMLDQVELGETASYGRPYLPVGDRIEHGAH